MLPPLQLATFAEEAIRAAKALKTSMAYTKAQRPHGATVENVILDAGLGACGLDLLAGEPPVELHRLAIGIYQLYFPAGYLPE